LTHDYKLTHDYIYADLTRKNHQTARSIFYQDKMKKDNFR